MSRFVPPWAAGVMAVAAEDRLAADDPPVWPLTARHTLGDALLDAHRSAEATRFSATICRNIHRTALRWPAWLPLNTRSDLHRVLRSTRRNCPRISHIVLSDRHAHRSFDFARPDHTERRLRDVRDRAGDRAPCATATAGRRRRQRRRCGDGAEYRADAVSCRRFRWASRRLASPAALLARLRSHSR